MKFIDAHVHVWTDDTAHYPLAAGWKKEDMKPPRFTPEDLQVREWRAPGGAGAQPYGMAVDHRDRIWFVASGPNPNQFVGFDPTTERFFSAVDIPSGGGTVRHMFFDAAAHAIWFGTDVNTIGRAVVE